MKFFGMGIWELLIILFVILLIFGPKNLPKLGSSIGKTVKNIREGMDSTTPSSDATTTTTTTTTTEAPSQIEGANVVDVKEETTTTTTNVNQ